MVHSSLYIHDYKCIFYIIFIFISLHIKRIIYTSLCMCVHAHCCGHVCIRQLHRDWCVESVTRRQEENLSLELHFKQHHFHLLLSNLVLKKVFNVCPLKQPLEASTPPATCKLYSVRHEQILKYGQANTLYLALGTQLKLDLPCAVSRSTTVSGIKLAELGTVAWSSVTLPSDGDADRI